MEESDKAKQIKGVPRFGKYLYALGMLTDAVNPPKKQIRDIRQAVAYLMGDSSELRFGSVLWGQGGYLRS